MGDFYRCQTFFCPGHQESGELFTMRVWPMWKDSAGWFCHTTVYHGHHPCSNHTISGYTSYEFGWTWYSFPERKASSFSVPPVTYCHPFSATKVRSSIFWWPRKEFSKFTLHLHYLHFDLWDGNQFGPTVYSMTLKDPHVAMVPFPCLATSCNIFEAFTEHVRWWTPWLDGFPMLIVLWFFHAQKHYFWYWTPRTFDTSQDFLILVCLKIKQLQLWWFTVIFRIKISHIWGVCSSPLKQTNLHFHPPGCARGPDGVSELVCQSFGSGWGQHLSFG